MLVNAVLVVLFLSIASTNILNKESNTTLASNCVEAVCLAGPKAQSGIYQIRLPLDGWTNQPFYVYCLLDDNGGDPWMLVQRRQDKHVNFYRNWYFYKIGFGNLNTNFFIGLDKLHALTQMQLNELHIELLDFNDTAKYAHYDSFAVGNESEKYTLNILGSYSGNAGDSMLGIHDGQKFTTFDRDNDDDSGRNCADSFKGGWWYNDCHKSNLNGEYYFGTKTKYARGINWHSWHGYDYSLKYVHMAIRPRDSANCVYKDVELKNQD